MICRRYCLKTFGWAYKFGSKLPTFHIYEQNKAKQLRNLDRINIIDSSETAQYILKNQKLKQFQDKNITIENEIIQNPNHASDQDKSTIRNKTTYNQKSWSKIKEITKNSHIQFSPKIQEAKNFIGIASEILTRGFKFERKQKEAKKIDIYTNRFKNYQYVQELVKSKIRAAEWANLRGNEGNTEYFLNEVNQISKDSRIKITIIKGDQLLQNGFRLMHAVGRASSNPPIFINLEYKGDSQSEQFHALVGKGLCFDSGGLNLKPTGGISGMHLDKHGACSVLSAFQSIIKLNLKANVIACLGFAQNFVSSNSYRPLDIIKSRKGLTVQIGNTDAEGRLVLADCMNWAQEHYKIKNMIELSTLTGAIVIALGKNRAGLFSNCDKLSTDLIQSSKQIEEHVWRMPIDEDHQDMIKPKSADLTNSAGKPDGSSCQAAAFLKNFVQKGVSWAHLDIAGAGMNDNIGTGYGAKLLVDFIRKQSLNKII